MDVQEPPNLTKKEANAQKVTPPNLTQTCTCPLEKLNTFWRDFIWSGKTKIELFGSYEKKICNQGETFKPKKSAPTV